MLSFGWTPKDIIQTAGRIKRLGQKKDVFIYILKGDYSKHLFSSYNLKPFSEQRHYEKVEEKLAEINENLKNTYNMGFLRTSEIYPNLFKKNDLLREDTVKFIDMVQADYIKREVITKAVAKIKSDISANYGQIYANRYESMLQRLDPRFSTGSIYIGGEDYGI